MIVIGAGVEGLSGAAARGLLALYAVLVGLSVGVMFIGLAGASIVATFSHRGQRLHGARLIGFTTERDLSGLGSFLTIVLVRPRRRDARQSLPSLGRARPRRRGHRHTALSPALPHMTHSVSSASTRSSHPCPVAPAPAWGAHPSISTFSTSSCRCCALYGKAPVNMISSDFWRQPADEVLGGLDATIDGMSSGEAARRRELFGPNRIIEAKKRHLLLDIGRRLANPLVAILLFASAIAGMTGDLVSFVIIVSVVLLSREWTSFRNVAPKRRPKL